MSDDHIIFEDVTICGVPPQEDNYEYILDYFNNNSVPICIIENTSDESYIFVGFTVAGRCRIENGFVIGSVVSHVDDFNTKYEHYSSGFVLDTQRFILLFKEKEVSDSEQQRNISDTTSFRFC